jgi:hypothetical protein
MSRPSGSKSRVIILFLACAALAAFYFANSANKAKSPSSEWKKGKVIIEDQTLDVYLAQTPAEREVGLSSFGGLKSDQGMLFVFESTGRPSFWMKNMKFPIDIIWINSNQVVDITKNLPVQYDSELIRYYPNVDVDRVLEVNAGWSEKNNIKAGDKVDISL